MADDALSHGGPKGLGEELVGRLGGAEAEPLRHDARGHPREVGGGHFVQPLLPDSRGDVVGGQVAVRRHCARRPALGQGLQPGDEPRFDRGGVPDHHLTGIGRLVGLPELGGHLGPGAAVDHFPAALAVTPAQVD